MTPFSEGARISGSASCFAPTAPVKKRGVKTRQRKLFFFTVTIFSLPSFLFQPNQFTRYIRLVSLLLRRTPVHQSRAPDRPAQLCGKSCNLLYDMLHGRGTAGDIHY
jgi:hypothetical protein